MATLAYEYATNAPVGNNFFLYRWQPDNGNKAEFFFWDTDVGARRLSIKIKYPIVRILSISIETIARLGSASRENYTLIDIVPKNDNVIQIQIKKLTNNELETVTLSCKQHSSDEIKYAFLDLKEKIESILANARFVDFLTQKKQNATQSGGENFYLLQEDALKFHEQFLQNVEYSGMADLIASTNWVIKPEITGRSQGTSLSEEELNQRDTAIMICDMCGVEMPGNNQNLEFAQTFHISSNFPKQYSLRGTVHKSFVKAVLFWVYPFSLQGVEVHLIGRRNGDRLSLVAFKFADKDNLLFENAGSYKQQGFKIEFPFFETQFDAARKKLRERVVNNKITTSTDQATTISNNFNGNRLTNELKRVMFGDELIHELTKKLGELTQEDMSYINIHFFPTTTNNTGGAGASKEDKSSTARGIMSNKTIEELINLFPILRL